MYTYFFSNKLHFYQIQINIFKQLSTRLQIIYNTFLLKI